MLGLDVRSKGKSHDCNDRHRDTAPNPRGGLFRSRCPLTGLESDRRRHQESQGNMQGKSDRVAQCSSQKERAQPEREMGTKVDSPHRRGNGEIAPAAGRRKIPPGPRFYPTSVACKAREIWMVTGCTGTGARSC